MRTTYEMEWTQHICGTDFNSNPRALYMRPRTHSHVFSRLYICVALRAHGFERKKKRNIS